MPEAGIFSYPMHTCAFYFILATNKEDFTMKITFPDGSVREFNEGVSAFDVAESIGSRLRKATIACEIDGERADAFAPIHSDCTLKLFTFADEGGRWAYRHTASHMLAQAVKRLYPDVKLLLRLRRARNLHAR